MFGIVGSDKSNAIVIFSSKLLLKYFSKAVLYDMLWMFPILLAPLIGSLNY